MAEAEGLDAHKRAVTIRVENYSRVDKEEKMEKLARKSVQQLTPYLSARRIGGCGDMA